MNFFVRKLGVILFASAWLIACGDDSATSSLSENMEMDDSQGLIGIESSESFAIDIASSSSTFIPAELTPYSSFGEASETFSSSSRIDTFMVSSSSMDPMPDHGVPYMRILVDDATVLSRTDSVGEPAYIECTVEVAGNGKYSDIPKRTAKIKQRGNSTRLWYDKKPYRIKFQDKTEMLGLAANKDWVLLANFRDPTNFMNALAFDMAREMGSFDFVNANRFVEVEINGDYKGLYQLTEQIERSENRVNIAADGVLLSLDQDDGPELSPEATDNFWSATYKLPVAVKYPKTLDENNRDQIRSDFKQLEDAIASADYDLVQTLLDVNTLIDFLILQEITRNVELEAPRSMYLYKASAQGKYAFGPVWDFDGGFGYSWNEETKEYFYSQSWILGSGNPSESPYNCIAEKKNDWGMCASSGFGGFGGALWDGSAASGFFTNLFSNEYFVADYKERWLQLASNISDVVSERLDSYSTENALAMENDAARWPWPQRNSGSGKNFSASILQLQTWIQKRIADYTAVVNGY